MIHPVVEDDIRQRDHVFCGRKQVISFFFRASIIIDVMDSLQK
jgi:hypothetical protein